MTRNVFPGWLAVLMFGLLGGWGNLQGAVEIVSGPKADVTATSAVVHWKTNVECGSRMMFGTTSDALNRKAESPGVTVDHEVTLEALQPGTTYFFSVGTARVTLATGSLKTIGKPGSGGPAPPST